MKTNNHPRLVLGDLGNIRGLSIRYLSSFIKENGIDTKLLFPLIPTKGFDKLPRLTEIQKKLVLQFLTENQITHFGCYLMTGHFRAFKELISFLRNSGWKGCIIAGGVHPTVMPSENLFDGVDFVVMGPGEKSLLDILQNKPLEKISGLVYKQDDKIIQNEVAKESLIDLNLLPFPDYDFQNHFIIRNTSIELITQSLFKELSGWGGEYYYLTTTRGCPYHCSYCCNVNRYKLRRSSVDRVLEELHYAKKKMPFLSGVNIQDDSFFMGSDEWLSEFCMKYKKEFGWPFIARIMPKFCSDKRLGMLKNAGLKYVSLGLQGSDRMNKEIYKRPENNDSFLVACHMLERLKIVFVVDVILDVVYETENDLREVAKTLNKLSPPYKVLAYGMTPFPGSEFYNKVKKDGLLDKFGADAYESMFKATRPDAYKTPIYWRNLIQNVIPLYKNNHIDRLINSNPDDESSVKLLKKYTKKSVSKMKTVERIRQKYPRFFTKAVSFYLFLKRIIRG